MPRFNTRPFRRIAITLVAFLWGMALPAAGHAARPVILSGHESAISLRPFVDILEDRSARWDLRQVLEAVQAEPWRFQPAEGFRRTAVYSDSAWWLRAKVINPTDTPRVMILVAGPPDLERVDFYLEQGGAWQHTAAGSLVPPALQQDPTRHPSLRLTLDPGESVQLMIRLKSHSPIRLNPFLYSRETFTAASITTTVADGLLIGGMAAAAWCALLIAVARRGRSFLWLAALTAAAALHEAAACAYVQRMFWSAESGWGYRLGLALGTLCLGLFVGFLHSVARHNRIPIPGTPVYAAIGATLLVLAALATILPIQVTALLALIMVVILALCMLASAALLFRRSRRTAGLIVFCGVLIIAAAAFETVNLPIVTAFSPSYLTLESGTPAITMLVMGVNLSLLTMWAFHNNHLRRRRYAASTRVKQRARVRLSLYPDHRWTPAARALRNAEESARQKTMILGYVSHDLRAPLATIAGYTQLLRQDAQPTQHKHLDVIERSVGYQFSLVDEILAYATAELQPFTIAPERIHLAALLEELARFGIALCGQHGNGFQYLPAPSLPAVVWLDGRRLRQAVLNLLSNAASYTTNGMVVFETLVREHHEHTVLELHVRNNGPAIAQEDQAGIFSAFKQSRGREGGAGLGLFIVERIVHGMGGTIHLESDPAAGTRFSLSVPLNVADPTSVVPASIHHSPDHDEQRLHLNAPPLAARLVLARRARDGEITAIAQWVDEARALHPECTPFYDEVAACIQAFDMERLQRLALLGVA
jgi:signal transduction histidine kinase